MSWAEIATLAASPDGNGGYRVDDAWGSTLVSDDGLQQLIDQQNLLDRFNEALNVFESWLAPLCPEHRRVWGRPEFRWSINDYAEWGDDPRSPLFMLDGWHGDNFCIVACVRGTLGGSLIACEGDWKRCEVTR